MDTGGAKENKVIQLTEVKVMVILNSEYESYVKARKNASLRYATKQKFCEAFVNDILDRYLSEDYMDPDFYDVVD